MRKLFFLCYITMLCSKLLYAQEDYYGKNLSSSLYTASQVIGNSAPQPPDVAAFQKVNFVPVSNYTGRVNVGIPIYTINSGLMSVPISLSYNTSGVKVNDMASSVGLNWSLNAGGMISKLTKGMDDFYPIYVKNGSAQPGGWLSYTDGVNYATSINQYQDAEPDIFTVNAPGISTKYIFKDSYAQNIHGVTYAINRLPVPVELEHKGNKIDITYKPHPPSSSVGVTSTFGVKGFDNTEITSISGVKYSFGSEETSRSNLAFKGKYTTFSGYRETVSNYKLDKMFDPSSNQTIDFEYEEYVVNFYDETKQSGGTYNGGSEIVFRNNGNSTTTYPKLHRLKKIIYEKGEVEFIYGFNRLDNPDEKALTEIKVKDIKGNVIKHIKLSYDYFQSNINTNSAQSKRLRLDKVYEVDQNLNELPGHTFTYENTYQMPPRGSYAHDFLGYNNGSYNLSISNPIPKLYLYYHNSPFTKYIRLTPFYDVNYINVTGNFSLEADVNYAKTYTLKKITFPSGGYNEYEYELNTFYYLSKVRQGGGLRIKTQKLYDDKGNTQILDYTYGSGYIVNFPIYGLFKGDLPINGANSITQTGIGLTTFLSPQSQVEFTQGAFVGYSNVIVKNRLNNGYKKFYYTNPGLSAYKNLEASITIPSSAADAESLNWKAIRTPSLFLDRDFLRGKITNEYVYTKDGDLRAETKYIYTQKEFSSIKLRYLNKSSFDPNDGCYSNSWTGYNMNYHNGKCGGYWEEIDLPVARDLLTTVVTRDYPVGNIIEGTQGESVNIPYTFRTNKNYVYDEILPLLIKETKRVSSCSEESNQGNTQDCTALSSDYDDRVSKEITYPIKFIGQTSTISAMPLATELIAQNRLSTPLKVDFKNKDGDIIASENHIYKNFDYNIIALENIDFVSRDDNITKSDRITKRGANGRVLEYQRKDGVFVSRIFGYEKLDYLVAEVVNSTHSDVLYTLRNNIQTSYNQSTMSNDVQIRQIMDELRLALPNTRITSYTYNYLVGINSVTDPRGKTVYYHYDSFNRLKYIKDSEENVLNENKYHYKNN
ncbi:hypothetical protein [Polaribacter sp. Asnod6-C07]|uniref:hypothetical protein n=1 Tax=Polaribacter sp. Asnod6-C07 TaxID=3160582 RepID=UPI00386D4701